MPREDSYFKKGDKRINRKGPPKLSKETLALKRLTREKLIQLLSKYFYIESGQLKELQADQKIPAIDLYIIRAISKGIVKGDVFSLDKLLDRAIGKVKDTEKTGEATTVNIIYDTKYRHNRRPRNKT